MIFSENSLEQFFYVSPKFGMVPQNSTIQI